MNPIMHHRQSPASRMSLLRLLTVLAVVASSMATASLIHSSSVSAAPAGPHRTAAASTSGAPCKPANEMTPSERAALPKTGAISCIPAGREGMAHRAAAQPNAAVQPNEISGYFSFCNTDITCAIGDFYFNSRTSADLTDVGVEDKKCDNRSAFADFYDQDGWTGKEFKNDMGCGTTKYFTGPYYDRNSSGIHYIYMRAYACNSTSCSSVVSSQKHYNSYW